MRLQTDNWTFRIDRILLASTKKEHGACLTNLEFLAGNIFLSSQVYL